jgi:phosphohistidine phosphatase
LRVLLVRHGHAVDEPPDLGDSGRWLSAKGRKATRRVARMLERGKKRRPAAIWTSTLVRAVQTAEILAETAGVVDVTAVAGLAPGHDPREVTDTLGKYEGPSPLALVGHEPSLSLLATALLGDVAVPPLKKSGVVIIDWDPAKGGSRASVIDPTTLDAERIK